jgi:Antibiotic biosynthesis monooxygenase
VVLHEFQVTPGAEQDFERSWHRVTALITQEHGSGGSRLHKAGGGEYVGYAQWPSRESWQARPPSSRALLESTAEMRGYCSSIRVLKELTVVDDLARPLPQQPGGAGACGADGALGRET